MRILFYIFFIGTCLTGYSQSNDLPVKLSLLTLVSDEVPVGLLSSRSVVVLGNSDAITRKDWEKVCRDFHGGFLQMGIDPVLYIHEQDLYANPKIHEAYMTLIRKRDISNLFIVRKKNSQFEMLITSTFDSKGQFIGKKAWQATDLEPLALLFKLGLVVKKSDLLASNFLILTEPEFVRDINFFKGSRLANYPGILRRQTLGVVRLDTIRIDRDETDASRKILESYNQRIKRYNQKLEAAFAGYPYEWEMFSFKDNEYALASGIQYVFQLVQTTGSGAKDYLNYPDHTKETQIISVTPGVVPGDVKLKRLSVETIVYKPYLYQARTDDVYVGEEWEADTTWEDAVRNFFFSLKRQLEE